MSENESKELFRMGRNSGEDVVISLSEYRERSFFDIRIWSKIIPGVRTESKPTRKGVCIPIEDLEEFLGGIEKLKETKGGADG